MISFLPLVISNVVVFTPSFLILPARTYLEQKSSGHSLLSLSVFFLPVALLLHAIPSLAF